MSVTKSEKPLNLLVVFLLVYNQFEQGEEVSNYEKRERRGGGREAVSHCPDFIFPFSPWLTESGLTRSGVEGPVKERERKVLSFPSFGSRKIVNHGTVYGEGVYDPLLAYVHTYLLTGTPVSLHHRIKSVYFTGGS